jgi:hypothetical protein
MVHPFTLRDAYLIRKLGNRGISFDSRTYLTRDLHLLRYATLAGLLPNLYPETQILDRPGNSCGFAQLSHSKGSPTSHLRFLAPKELFTGNSGSGLIEALLKEAGRREAQHILAEVEENSEEYNFFRCEGFTIFARQEIWKSGPTPLRNERLPEGLLRSFQSVDAPAALGLYCSVVPSLVYQMEGFPKNPEGWVLYEEGEMVGFFGALSGPLGLRVEPVFHPGARNVASWMTAWLSAPDFPAGRPAYVCVRSYQDWVGSILRDAGFSLFSRQAVFSRRIVVPVPVLEGIHISAKENPAPQATTYTRGASPTAYDTATSDHR